MTWAKKSSGSGYDPANKADLDRLGINGNRVTIDGVIPPDGTYVDPLRGLKWACLGDSITYYPFSYWQHIADRTGIIPTSYGVSGTTIAVRPSRGLADSFVERYPSMDVTADIITVLGGVNDSIQDIPIGTSTDTVNTTYYGACNALLSGLILQYPGKRIGVMTPMKYCRQQYVDVLTEVANKYAIPVLDLYNGSGLDNSLTYMIQNYFMDQDRLHPNDAGHNIISRRIEAFLRSI